MDAVIISDYHKGLVCEDTISAVMKWKKDSNKIVVADTKELM